VNYYNSLVVTITVTCYSWAPSSDDHLFTCGAILWPPHQERLRYWIPSSWSLRRVGSQILVLRLPHFLHAPTQNSKDL